MSRTINTRGTHQGVVHSVPSSTEVSVQMERILGDRVFQGSSRRRDLLRHLVEETLGGRSDHLKGFNVALAVFGRNQSFDAGADPVVRLEAGRLRRSLETYYTDAGKSDPVRITIPKGAYVPNFAWQLNAEQTPAAQTDPINLSPSAAAPRSTVPFRVLRLTLVVVTFVALAALAAAGSLLLHRRSQLSSGPVGPAVIVLPFDSLGSGETEHLASGLTYEVITDLMKYSHFRMYSTPPSFRQSGQADPQALGRDLGVAYVVKGALSAVGNKARLAVQLYDAETGRIVWSDSYDRNLTPGDLLQVQGELAASIATVLGEPYGKVSADLTERVAAGTVPSMPSYSCVLRAYDYRRSFNEELYNPVLACLTDAVVRDPQYASAWAMLGWLQLDAVRFHYTADDRKKTELNQAIQSASHAVDLDKSNPLALQALAASLYYAGRYEESMEFQRGALALNENDPDTLAQLGWRLAARGQFDEGISYLERAVARSANPPGWYFHLLAVNDYLQGDFQRMLERAERSSVDGSGTSWSFIAIANGALGKRDEALKALEHWAKIAPIAYADPAAEYRTHGGIDATVDALMDGLREAGWTPPRKVE